ncbi:T-cell-interacting, activating receptor on myeloid cells protein 1-like isoform X1 [Haemorhous mexicanus]|uniref:T-cell-interacting, activating receptor on myeloid cells protein 1-like isoform X1 n=1 Tax=Haemorhous mexicanus TaxID=30427 RepID=UPI0028BE8209|nr:T-cell-interacting, activating receptor on myeloid cells protein 1-like isoform X1 [Haemorhous mexicanus]
MLPVTCVLALGAWLVSQGEATLSTPTISIFQKPPGVIPPGGSTTICCICQCSNGSFVLYKGSRQLCTLEQSSGRAEFSISNATYEDRGGYNCHYLEGDTVLARSASLEVFVEELRLPRPDLSVLPGHEVAAGAEVMFRCTTTQPSTGCFLYLEGQIRPQQFLREQGDYSFSLVQKGDSGRYSCQCYTLSAWREWSAVSNTLDLVVRVASEGQLHVSSLLSIFGATWWGHRLHAVQHRAPGAGGRAAAPAGAHRGGGGAEPLLPGLGEQCRAPPGTAALIALQQPALG